MTNDPFALYKLPLGVSATVDIPLPGTPAVFSVMLPATSNEDFNLTLISMLNTDLDEDGNLKVDAVKFQAARKKLFFDKCIKDASGLPDGMDPPEFFEAYPLAARALLERATELASQADDEVNDALGKSETLPNGKSSGEVDMSNTTSLSKKASKSKQGGQNLVA